MSTRKASPTRVKNFLQILVKKVIYFYYTIFIIPFSIKFVFPPLHLNNVISLFPAKLYPLKCRDSLKESNGQMHVEQFVLISHIHIVLSYTTVSFFKTFTSFSVCILKILSILKYIYIYIYYVELEVFN